MGGSLLVLGMPATSTRTDALHRALAVLQLHLRCSLQTAASGFVDSVSLEEGLQLAQRGPALLLRIEHEVFPWDDFEPELQGRLGPEDSLGSAVLPGLHTLSIRCAESVEHLPYHPSMRRRQVAAQQWELLRKVLTTALADPAVAAVAVVRQDSPSLLGDGLQLLGVRSPAILADLIAQLRLSGAAGPTYVLPQRERAEAFLQSSGPMLVRSCGWGTAHLALGSAAGWWLAPSLIDHWAPHLAEVERPRSGIGASAPMPRLLLALANSALLEVADPEDRQVLDRLRRADSGGSADRYFRTLLEGLPSEEPRRNRYVAGLSLGLVRADGALAHVSPELVPALVGGPSNVLLEGLPKATYHGLEDSLVISGPSMLLRGKLQGPLPGQVQVLVGYLPPRELRLSYARPIEGKGFGSFDVQLLDDGRSDPAVVVRKYTFPPTSTAQEDRIDRTYRRLQSFLGPYHPRTVTAEGPAAVVTLPRTESMPLVFRLLQELYDSDPIMADIGLQLIGVGEGPLVALLERKAAVLYDLRIDDYQLQGNILSDHALWSPVCNANRRLVETEVTPGSWPSLASVVVESLSQLELAQLTYDRRRSNDPFAPHIRLELLHRHGRAGTLLRADFCDYPNRREYQPAKDALESALGTTLLPQERGYR